MRLKNEKIKKDIVLFIYDDNSYKSSAENLTEKSKKNDFKREYYVTGIQNIKKKLIEIYDSGYKDVFLQPLNCISRKNIKKIENYIVELQNKFNFIKLENHLMKKIVDVLTYDKELFVKLYFEYSENGNCDEDISFIFVHSDKDQVSKINYLALNYIFESNFIHNVYFCSIYDEHQFDKIVCNIISKNGYKAKIIPFILKESISEKFSEQLEFEFKEWLETREIKTEISKKILLDCEFFLSQLLGNKKMFKKMLTNRG